MIQYINVGSKTDKYRISLFYYSELNEMVT